MDDFYEFVFLPRHSFTMLCFFFVYVIIINIMCCVYCEKKVNFSYN